MSIDVGRLARALDEHICAMPGGYVRPCDERCAPAVARYYDRLAPADTGLREAARAVVDGWNDYIEALAGRGHEGPHIPESALEGGCGPCAGAQYGTEVAMSQYVVPALRAALDAEAAGAAGRLAARARFHNPPAPDPSDALREAAQDYLANDGSEGRYDAAAMIDARARLRAALRKPEETGAPHE